MKRLGCQILLFWWQNNIILRFTRFLWIHMNLQQFMVSSGSIWRHTTPDLKFKPKAVFQSTIILFSPYIFTYWSCVSNFLMILQKNEPFFPFWFHCEKEVAFDWLFSQAKCTWYDMIDFAITDGPIRLFSKSDFTQIIVNSWTELLQKMYLWSGVFHFGTEEVRQQVKKISLFF